MPSERYNLGKLEHIHNNQNIKLKTNISITLLSAEHIPPLSSHLSNIETLIASGIWIAGGNRLHFHIQFLFEDIVISDIAGRDFTEDVGVMLCNAEIWSQLDLNASLSLVEKDGYQSGHYSQVSLTLSRKSSEPLDVHPPQGVLSAVPEAVSLLLSFSTCRRARAPMKTHGRRKVHRKKRDQNDSWLLQPTDTLAEQNGDGKRSSDEWLPLDTDKGAAHCCMADIERDDDSSSWTPFSSSSTTTSPISSQSSDSSYSSKDSAPLNAFSCDFVSAARKVSSEDILRLVNDSLSIVIRDRRPKNSGGVILSGDTGFPRLDAISPAFFSPGYLKNPPGHYRGLETSIPGTCDDDKFTSVASIESLLWDLLQQRTIDPCSWPRWAGQILNASRLNHAQNRDSCMLDEACLDPPIGTALDWEDDDRVPISQIQVFDDSFDFDVDDEVLDGGSFMVSHYNEDLLKNRDTIAEGGYADGVDLWSALDNDFDGDLSDEILFEDIIQASGQVEDDLPAISKDIESAEQHFPNDSSKIDQVKIHCHQPSDNDLCQYKPWEGGPEKVWGGEPDVILDDSMSVVIDKRPFGKDFENQILDDMIDGQIETSHDEGLCDHEMIDLGVTVSNADERNNLPIFI